MELLRKIGKQYEAYDYEDLRKERSGFLNVYSFGIKGYTHRMELLERGNASVVLPVDYAHRCVYMIQQPRHVLAFAANPEGRAALEIAKHDGGNASAFSLSTESVSIFELAAGVIEEGETPEKAALRELQEETGFVVAEDALKKIGTYHPSIGESTLLMHAYIASLPDPIVAAPTDGDGNESIRLWRMSFEEAWELVDSGRIRTASSMILLRELKIQELQKKAPR